MGNVLIIAKKELSDLLNSYLMVVVLLVYLALIVQSVYGFLFRFNQGSFTLSDVFEFSLAWSLYTIPFYGGFISVVLGCSSISSEKEGHAFNLLLTKPLRRTTVINGKLLGIFAFLFVILTMAIIIFFSSILVIFGNAIQAYFSAFLLRLLIVLFVSLAYCMVFASLAILISTIARSQMVALTVSMFTIVLSELVITDNFAGTISLFLHTMFGFSSDDVCYFIVNLSPPGVIGLTAYRGLFNPLLSLDYVLNAYAVNFLTLGAEAVLFTVICYIVFMRKDIQ